MKKVVVLGSTGSIGCSTLKVAGDIPERLKIIGLAAGSNDVKLAEQIAETGVKHVALSDLDAAARLRQNVDGVEVYEGQDGLIELATLAEADMVLVAIVGVAGLRPALAAIEAGKDLAIASKEILVMAGQAVMEAARRKGVRVLPVDSEHNAIFQCLEGVKEGHVSRLILTASGGPFRTASTNDIRKATPATALKHPTWDMGQKISIDSATMFNKGLEMIEARWLFDMPMEKIDVVIHPQSIVHSMVETVDGSVIAQLSRSDMCFPIQYAVTYPDRVANSLKPLNFAELGKLEFEEPRHDVFPALKLARKAGNEGGTLPAVLNAANEVAVMGFLAGQISFPDIWRIVANAMEAHTNKGDTSLEAAVDADFWARHFAAAEVANSR